MLFISPNERGQAETNIFASAGPRASNFDQLEGVFNVNHAPSPGKMEYAEERQPRCGIEISVCVEVHWQIHGSSLVF